MVERWIVAPFVTGSIPVAEKYNFFKIHNNKMKPVVIGAIVAAIAILLFIFMKTRKPKSKAAAEVPSADKKKGKIFGVMTCPHTVTQTKKYPDYDFVDCTIVGSCPAFVTAYPTTEHPDGNIVVGA